MNRRSVWVVTGLAAVALAALAIGVARNHFPNGSATPAVGIPAAPSAPGNFYYLKTDGFGQTDINWSIIKSSEDGSQKETLFSNSDYANQVIFVPSKQLVVAGGINSVFPEVDVYDLVAGKETTLYRDGIISTSTGPEGDLRTCNGVVSGLGVSPDGSTITVLRRDDYAFNCGHGEALITFSWNGTGYAKTNTLSSTSTYTDFDAFVSPLFSTDHSHAVMIVGGDKEGAPGLGTLSLIDLSTGSSTLPLSGDESIVTSNIVANENATKGYFVVNDAVPYNLETGMGGPLDGITVKEIDLSTLAIRSVYTATDTMSGLTPIALSKDDNSLLLRRSHYDEPPRPSDLLELDITSGTTAPATSISDWGKAHHTLVWENAPMAPSTVSPGTSFIVNGIVIDTSTLYSDSGLLDQPFTYLGSAQ